MSKTKARAAATAGEDRQFVTALARGLDLLRCFDQPGAIWTVSDLARRIGLSQPTTWRLAHTLLECGYLTRDPGSAGLRIGVPALTLGYAAIQGIDFPGAALPYMQQITAQLRITTTLTFREGPEMISVCRCDGDFVRPNQPVGWRAPMTTVPSGLAVLAALPELKRSEAMEQIRALEPLRWPRLAARVEEACADYARDGYVMQTGMMKGQYAGIAVPLIGDAARGGTVWAMSCGGIASLWTEGELRVAGGELLRVRAFLEPALAGATGPSS